MDLTDLVARVRRDVTAVYTGQRMAWTREPLTDERLQEHLDGGRARGVGFIAAGGDRTSVACLDLDAHEGETSWEGMIEALDQVVAALRKRGLEPSVWRSRGGRGIHIWILWERAQPAWVVREELRAALAAAGYRPGTGGVAAGQIEIFPKQDTVPVGGFGNQVILPGTGASVPLVERLGWAPGAQGPWPLNGDLGERDRPEPLAPLVWDIAGVEAEPLAELLRGSTLRVDDYDDWVKAGMACHAESGGADWGLRIWQDWSRTSSKYPGDEALESKWASFGRRDGPLVTARSLGTPPAQPGDFAAIDVGEEPEPLRLTRDKKGRADPTLPNLGEVLRRWDLTGWRIQWDAYLGVDVLTIGTEPRRVATDADMVAFRERLERGGGPLGPGFRAVGRDLFRDAALKAAQADAIDSGIEWLTSAERVLGWDGMPRVEAFLSRYLGAQDDEYTRSVGRYIWTGLVGRLLEPGCQADMVPILIGEQGAGKSTAVQMLAPDPAWFCEIGLSDQKDADLSRKMRGVSVVELGELSGLRARDREWLKAFVTRRVERWTPKYMERDISMPRRCLMIGTTNERTLFNDATGERRWLPVEVGLLDREALLEDRPQLWLEGLALWREGGIQYDDAERLGAGRHDAYRDEDPWTEAVLRWVAEPAGGQSPAEAGYTVQQVWCGALGGTPSNLSRGAEMRLANLLKSAGAEKCRSRHAGFRTWRWFGPAGVA